MPLHPLTLDDVLPFIRVTAHGAMADSVRPAPVPPRRDPSCVMLAGTLRRLSGIELPCIGQPKIDGVRLWFDADGTPRLRSGQTLANADLDAALRATGLRNIDGELRAGAGFAATLSLIQRHRGMADCTFFAFDVIMDHGVTSQRLALLPAARQHGALRITPLTGTVLTTRRQLADFESACAAREDCDGIILRNPYGRYYRARSGDRWSSLLKFKRRQDDCATITDVFASTIEVIWKGRSIRLMASGHRLTPAHIGARAEFAFMGLTRSGTPRHARFIRIREQ